MEPAKIYLEDGQPREKVGTARGCATYYRNGDVDFKAYAQGEPQREDVKKKGQSTCYRTVGKEPKRVAHLVIDDKAPDPQAALQEELDKFLAGFGKKQPKEPQPLKRDRVLCNDNDLKVWVKKDADEVRITLSLPLEHVEALQKNMLTKTQKIYQCFTINKLFLRDAVLARKKTSSE